MDLAIIDTNVLVSGLYRPQNPPGRVLQAVTSGPLVPMFDARVLAEYATVLMRPQFRAAYSIADVDAVLLAFVHRGISAGDVDPYPRPLPDEGDRAFVEVAIATGCPIVTGNARDFPAELGIEVITPADMARRLGL